MIPMTRTAAIALLLPLSPVRAEPLAGFDAFTAWDQRLPGLLEFIALEFPAPPPEAAHPGLNLVAADGGTTLRAREHIRFNGLISLFGDFRFEAPAIDFGGAHILSYGRANAFIGFDDLDPSGLASEPGSSVTLGLGSHPLIPTVGITAHIIALGPLVGPELSSFDPRTEVQAVALKLHTPTTAVYGGTVELLDFHTTLDPVPLPATAPLLSASLGLFALRVRRR
jgi:hypothetical protein